MKLFFMKSISWLFPIIGSFLFFLTTVLLHEKGGLIIAGWGGGVLGIVFLCVTGCKFHVSDSSMLKNSVGVKTGNLDFLKSLMFLVIMYSTPACFADSCNTESSKSVNFDFNALSITIRLTDATSNKLIIELMPIKAFLLSKCFDNR